MRNIVFIAPLFALCAAAYGEPMNLPAGVPEAFAKAGLPLLREKLRIRDFSLTALDGGVITLTSLKGKVVFLNFWATWCPPCRAEMPSMEILYQRYKNAGLEFIAVDIMENPQAVRNFLKNTSYTFPIVLDADAAVSRQYGIQAVPATFIIDRDGMIIFAGAGARNWNSPAVFAAFEQLLSRE
ncbi:MAG: TlpA family protein disulfide reductase [Spirochaetaceae bacterium]|jgi:thiol-disulfide isomerase/thioredoxin|nr:TlpA family protein disulfide reductase [Spirochaetaceae bacterium]